MKYWCWKLRILLKNINGFDVGDPFSLKKNEGDDLSWHLTVLKWRNEPSFHTEAYNAEYF